MLKSKQIQTKYKETEIVTIPEEWETVNIGDILTLEYGKALREDNRVAGEFPVYGSNGIVGFHNEKLVDGPGIIVGRKGSAGEIIWSAEDFFPIDTTYFVKTTLNKKFVYYLLKNTNIKKLVGSSAVPGLNRNDVYSQEVVIPAKHNEQKQIAEIFSSLDDKIELDRKINTNLEKLAGSLFKKWFIDIGDKLPEGWRMGTIGDFAKIKSGFAFKGSDFIDQGVPVIKIKNIVEPNVDLNSVNYVVEEVISERARNFILEAGDILIAMSGNTTGKIGIMPKTKNNYVLNQRVGKYFLKDKNNLGYVYFYLRSGSIQEDIIQSAYGSAQPNISPDILEGIKILIPNADLLENFNKISNELINTIINNNFEISILSELRDSLLPRLMSGKIRVK